MSESQFCYALTIGVLLGGGVGVIVGIVHGVRLARRGP